MIWDFEKLISRRLMLWAILSILAGAGLSLFGDAFWRAFGIQALAWGAVDALIAWFGLRRLREKVQTPTPFKTEEKEAAQLRKILWINCALDVLYIAGGALTTVFFGAESAIWRGTGWGVILQGAFLFLFDMMHALRVPDPLQFPHLPLFTHPDHEPFLYKGGAPAAVLVHGFPGTALEMRPLGQALNAAGWTVQGLRLPGFGVEIEDLIEYQNEDWVKAVAAACKTLRSEGHDPILLIGYSFGGALALQVAAQQPVDGLILIAPFTWREPTWAKTLLDYGRALLPLSLHPYQHILIDRLDLTNRYQAYLPEVDLENPQNLQEFAHLQVPLALLDHARHVGRKALETAADVQSPTLIIHSADDLIIRPDSVTYLQSKLHGHVTRETVKGPHSLTMPHNPGFEDVAAKTLTFAAGIMEQNPK